MRSESQGSKVSKRSQFVLTTAEDPSRFSFSIEIEQYQKVNARF